MYKYYLHLCKKLDNIITHNIIQCYYFFMIFSAKLIIFMISVLYIYKPEIINIINIYIYICVIL